MHRPSRKRLGIGCGLALIVFIGAVILIGSHGQAAPPASTPTTAPVAHVTQAIATSAPTKAVTQVPTPHVTATTQPTAQATATVAPVSGPALLGSDIGTFVANYGQPNSHTDVAGGLYHFQRYPGSNIDFLIVMVDLADGGVYGTRVENVDVQAPDAGWTAQQADAECAAFLPRDAVYKNQVGLSGGYDKIYFSASLAALFLATAFTDANGNQVQAGLFDVQYLYQGQLAASPLDGCSILIGTQQTQ